MNSNSQNNLTDQAYHLILVKIINAQFKPGEKISAAKIEDAIGIGRTPVREALLRLRQDSLINVIPQSGTYVAKIDIKAVLDARFVRASVERRVMQEAAVIDLNDQQIANFKRILLDQKTRFESKDYINFFRSDDEFHRYFYIITDHQRIWDWLKRINVQFDRFRFLRLKVTNLSWNGLVDQHKAILQAVLSKDINEVERLTANHMHLMLKEEDSLINSFPDYFVNYHKQD